METVANYIKLIFIILVFGYMAYSFLVRRRYGKSHQPRQVINQDKVVGTVQQFIEEKPECLSAFNLTKVPDNVSVPFGKEDSFVCRLIECRCGEKDLNVYSSSNGEMLLAPISVECPKCNLKSLIFDPSKHGWDGEFGESSALIGDADPQRVNNVPSPIVVCYSFQGEENYADLIEESVQNPQDYFDTFMVSTVTESGKLSEVVSYECS